MNAIKDKLMQRILTSIKEEHNYNERKIDRIDLTFCLYQIQLLQFQSEHCNLIVNYNSIEGTLSVCFGDHDDAPICFIKCGISLTDMKCELRKLNLLFDKYELNS